MAKPSADGIRLLIVDDDEQLRQSLTRRFEKQGHMVRAAASGEEALAKAFPCDVALSICTCPA